jgi:hypothetical protein
MIATAKVADKKQEDDLEFTMPLATIMAIHGFVATGAATTAVEQLANQLAADPEADISELVKQLKQVHVCCCLCLCTLFTAFLCILLAHCMLMNANLYLHFYFTLLNHITLCITTAVWLQAFSGSALTSKFGSTGITQLSVFNSLLSTGEYTFHML